MADVITRFKVETSEFDRKTKEASKTLEIFGKKGATVGGDVKKLTDAIGLNVGALTKLTTGLGVASAAVKVAGDAMKQNEVIYDDWCATVKIAEDVYSGFLNSLNTGDISGYLHNINNIVNAARDAYNALDELGTYNAFNQINTEAARTGLTDALADFRAGNGSKEAVSAAADELKKQLQDRQKLEQNAYDAAIAELAATRGVDADMLKKAMSGSYGDYKALKGLGLSGTKTETHTTMYGMAYTTQASVAANEEEKLGQMLRNFNDTQLQDLQALGAQAQRTATEVANVDRQVARYLKETETKVTKTTGAAGSKDPAVEGTIRYYEEMISNLRKQIGNEVDATVRAQLANTIRVAQEELSKMQGGGSAWALSGASTTSASTASTSLKSAAANMDTSGVQKAAEDWADYQKNIKLAREENQRAAMAIGSVGRALQSIGNPAAQVMGIIAEAVASVASSFATALSFDTSSKSSIYAWIAAAAAGTATMVSTISSIKSATRFAEGGEIKGTRYSGDSIPAMLNAGEYVFNRAQLGNLASQLQSGSSAQSSTPYLDVETIYVGLNNHLQRTGRGVLLTSNR